MSRVSRIVRVSVSLAVACAAYAAAPRAAADATAPSTARIDVPITQMVLPNGDTRYSVPVSVGSGAPIEAELDTGSFGLRVLKAALKPDQYRATDNQRRYPFGSGARLNGFLAEAPLSVGPARTDRPMLFQVVESIDCMEEMPKCPVSRVKPEEYLIAGDGFPNKGYQAIIGISLRSPPMEAVANNPLINIGQTAWIVILPRPGSSAQGHLIISPTPEDRKGFVTMSLERRGDGWGDQALPGCLVDEQSKERTCGRTLVDSGAPGIRVNSDDSTEPSRWPLGRPGRIELGDAKPPIAVPFTAGDDWSVRVSMRPRRDPDAPQLAVGTLPYFRYAILYDFKAGTMGFKPRDDKEP